jgi:simple sugar transport system permease protein
MIGETESPASHMAMLDSVVPPAAAAPPSRRGGGTIAQRLAGLVLRPELTAVLGTIIVFTCFAFSAGGSGFLSRAGTINYLGVAAEIGIIAIPVTLLLIAGEFDLSVGAVVGASGMIMVYPMVDHGWPLAAAIPVGLAFAALVGVINGLLTVRTTIPSFLVTLAMMYLLSGTAVALSDRLLGSTNVYGLHAALKGDPLLGLFDGTVVGLPVEIWWWIGLTAIATYVLVRTPFGNWIYAAGGNLDSARKLAVPVARVKIILFVCTAMASTLVALLSSFNVDGADATNGADKLFQAPVAAVIGGALLTGGFGSIIGTAFGALLFGMISQGFFFTNIDSNWFETFLGAMMLIAVFVNDYIRRRSLRQRRAR